jgi:integrase
MRLQKIEEHINAIVRESDWDQLSAEKLKDELSYRLTGKRINTLNFNQYANIPVLDEYNANISFGQVNYNLLKDLASWMEKTTSKAHKKNYKKNYISQTIQKIKSKYRKAVKEGLARPVNLDFTYGMEKTYAVYLSEKELELLENVKLSKPREYARDVFLVCCYTGMRAGNYTRLRDVNINLEEGYIEEVMNKTGGKVKIPLHRVVRKMIGKYGKIPTFRNTTNLNRLIKKICGVAGITEPIEIVRTIGGVKERVWVPKNELISSHTARRSMATNLYLRKVPLRYIMSITGHTSEKMCLLYIKAGVNDMYEEVAKLDFWK